MEKFVIHGGKQLSGRITPSGSKNEALPVIAATLLTDERVEIENVPHIRDVPVMCEILESLGASVIWTGDHSLSICACGVKESVLSEELCGRVRASILFAGPLLARLHSVTLPPPGGDVIGRRRLDTHFDAFEALGATVSVDKNYDIRANAIIGADVFLDEASVTATENALMLAVLAKGHTILRNVASEPHVCGLARLLVSMGAKISGIGTNVLEIDGVESLHGAHHHIGSDYLEIGSLIGLAAVTHSELTITDAWTEDLRMIRLVFERLGVHTELDEATHNLFVSADQTLRIRPDYHGHTPKIDDSPWPAFPTDLMSIAITVATQCSGTVLFFEKMFDGRMFFVDHLQSLGAQIILCDPHRVVVVGPQPLRGGRVQSPDVRAGMAVLIAGLCSKGETEIYNIAQIDRGYEKIDVKLRALGADIERA